MQRALVLVGLSSIVAFAACGTAAPAGGPGSGTDAGVVVLPDGAVVPAPTADAEPLPVPPADGGELPGFSFRAYTAPPGENPGGLVAYAEAPSGNPSRSVVVVLHGCTQRAADMAASGWTDAATAFGFVALYPEQTAANDATTCFRWYTPDHASRGKGELASIAALASDAKARLAADHVYVAGLSAGGAMAAALLASYPELFEAASLSAGIAFGCATSPLEGATCAGAPKSLTPTAWGDLVRAAAAPAPGVRVQLWQGDADPIVKPANADALVAQWTNVAGVDAVADEEVQQGKVTRRSYKDASGKTRVELGVVRGMGHGTAIASIGADAPCGRPGPYAVDVGVCAAAGAARFFGLTRRSP